MNRKLDLNTLETPLLELVLCDPDKTVVHVTLPEKRLINRLLKLSGELHAVQDKQDGEMLESLYSFAAELINANTDGITVTGAELETKYGLKFVHLVYIFREYLDFVGSIQNGKN